MSVSECPILLSSAQVHKSHFRTSYLLLYLRTYPVPFLKAHTSNSQLPIPHLHPQDDHYDILSPTLPASILLSPLTIAQTTNPTTSTPVSLSYPCSTKAPARISKPPFSTSYAPSPTALQRNRRPNTVTTSYETIGTVLPTPTHPRDVDRRCGCGD